MAEEHQPTTEPQANGGAEQEMPAIRGRSAAGARFKGIGQAWRVGVIVPVVVGIAVVGWWVYRQANQDPLGAAAKLPSVGSVKTTPGGRPTPNYREVQEQAEAIERKRAVERGESFVPEPVQNADAPLITLAEPEPEPQPEPQPEPEPRQRAGDERVGSGMTEAMREILNAWAIEPHAVYVYADAVEPPEPAAGEATPVSTAEGTPAEGAQQPPPAPVPAGLRPGDVLYAQSDLRLSSDYPRSPAVATVVAGPFRGARFIGSFARFEDRLIIEYTSLVLSDGSTYPVRAYAVDPSIPSADVASRVDHHYLSRWGGIIAAGFFDGLLEAARASRASNITITDNGTVVESTDSIARDAAIATVIGAIGSRLSRAAERNFDRPITVEYDAVPVGILVVALGDEARAQRIPLEVAAAQAQAADRAARSGANAAPLMTVSGGAGVNEGGVR